MPKAIKKRAVKKSDREDNLSETVVDIRERIKERQRTLVYSLIAFGVVLAAVAAFFIYNRTTTGKAQELAFEGDKLLYSDAQASPASPDRYKSALEKFKQSYSAKKTPEALLNIANCYYALGNYDEAIKSLDEFVRQFSDPNMVSLAYHKKAMAYMKKGDTNNALGTLDSLAKLKGGSLQDVALLESGEMLESMGKPEDAKSKYKELISKFPNSTLAAQAKAKLGNS